MMDARLNCPRGACPRQHVCSCFFHLLSKQLLNAVMLRDEVGFGEESPFPLLRFQRLYYCDSALDESPWQMMVRPLEN